MLLAALPAAGIRAVSPPVVGRASAEGSMEEGSTVEAGMVEAAASRPTSRNRNSEPSEHLRN